MSGKPDYIITLEARCRTEGQRDRGALQEELKVEVGDTQEKGPGDEEEDRSPDVAGSRSEMTDSKAEEGCEWDEGLSEKT
jgi:hypothetical protein